MPLITKIHKNPVGDFAVKFSLRSGLFEIEYAGNDEEIARKLSHACITHNHKLETWADVERELQSVVNQFRHEFLLTRKVIILQVQTSASTYTFQKKRYFDGKEEAVPLDHMSDSEGFQIKWYVAEEYAYPNSKHLFYRILETNPNCRNKKYYTVDMDGRDRANILPQLISDNDGSVRVFDYTESLYVFVQEIQNSIDGLLHRMIDYFSVDQEKFLTNVANQMRLLPPPPDSISDNPQK